MKENWKGNFKRYFKGYFKEDFNSIYGRMVMISQENGVLAPHLWEIWGIEVFQLKLVIFRALMHRAGHVYQASVSSRYFLVNHPISNYLMTAPGW